MTWSFEMPASSDSRTIVSPRARSESISGPNAATFAQLPAHREDVRFDVAADHEERRERVPRPEGVQYRGRPRSVRAVIEGQRDPMRAVSVSLYDIRRRIPRNAFAGEESGFLIRGDRSATRRRCGGKPKYLSARARKFRIVTRRNRLDSAFGRADVA